MPLRNLPHRLYRSPECRLTNRRAIGHLLAGTMAPAARRELETDVRRAATAFVSTSNQPTRPCLREPKQELERYRQPATSVSQHQDCSGGCSPRHGFFRRRVSVANSEEKHAPRVLVSAP